MPEEQVCLLNVQPAFVADPSDMWVQGAMILEESELVLVPRTVSNSHKMRPLFSLRTVSRAEELQLYN